MTNSSDENATTNKGVNVRSESFSVRVHRPNEFESSSSNTPTSRSINDIKNEIQNVLELMGPTTPIISSIYNQGSDADNDTSTATISERKRKAPSVHRRPSPEDSKQDSVLADLGTCSMTNIDNVEEADASCCDHHHHCHPPECLCVMNYGCYMTQVVPPRTCQANTSDRVAKAVSKKTSIIDWIKHRSYDLMWKRSSHAYNPGDLYKLNICGQQNDNPPRRVVFDLIDGIPKPTCTTVATNTLRSPAKKPVNCGCKNLKSMANESVTHQQKKIFYDGDGNARVDYYYFDHGNCHFFHTTDSPPVMKCEILAEKTERFTTRFWAEFFASIHIGVAFCISFVLQLFKFLLYSFLRPLTIGVMQLGSDYFLKPFLTTFFNGLIQPILIFAYNIATSLRDLCDPIAEAIGFFCRELAVLLRAVRLCSYKKNTEEGNNYCKKERKCEC